MVMSKTAQHIFAPVDENGAARSISEHEVGVWGTEVERILAALGAGELDPSDLPPSWVSATDTGAGTTNAIEATTVLPVTDAFLVVMNIAKTNGPGPVTVRFNGGETYNVKTNSGNDPVEGGLVSGLLVLGRISGSTFRLLSDQTSSALQAEMEEMLAQALAAAEQASSAVPSSFPATRSALKALSTATTKYAYLTERGYEGQFILREGNFSSQVASDPNEAIYVKANDSAVTARVWVRVFDGELTPRMFGGIGINGGSMNDGPAINRMFDYVRALQGAMNIYSNIGLKINLSGAWRTTVSLNATGIQMWSFSINGGTIIGACTGKAVLDLCGSRGYLIQSLHIHGERENKPACGLQTARRTASDYCDNQEFFDVSTTGYFTRTAFHGYGHETCKHHHCTYFNYEHTARVAIFEGFSGTPFTSDYTTVMSGPTSFINNNVDTCDFRYLPMYDNVAQISAVTNEANGLFTLPSTHTFQVGEYVTFAAVGGLGALIYRVSQITERTATSIRVAVDTRTSVAGMGVYTGGGIVVRASTKSPVYLSRMSQFNFVSSYIVSYGQPGLEIAFPDPGFKYYDRIDLDILFEGAGQQHNIFLNGSGDCRFYGFSFKTYKTIAAQSIIGDYAPDAGLTYTFYAPEIISVNPYFQVGAVGDFLYPANIFSMYGADVTFTNLASSQVAAMATFRGRLIDATTGETYQYGSRMQDAVIAPRATAPTARQGGLWLDSATGKLKLCEDGSTWRTITTT